MYVVYYLLDLDELLNSFHRKSVEMEVGQNLFLSGLSGYQICLYNLHLLSDAFINKVSEGSLLTGFLSISQARLIFSASAILS